jgi:excisionase family DNA binding protein
MKRLISITEATKEYGIGRDRIYQLIRSKDYDIPAIKIGKSYKINTLLMDEWLIEMTKNEKELLI